MTLATFILIAVVTLLIALLLDQFRHRWPRARQAAMVIVAILALYAGVAMLLGVIESIGVGRSSDASSAGSVVIAHRDSSPIRFWFFSTLKIIACASIIAASLWAVKKSITSQK